MRFCTAIEQQIRLQKATLLVCASRPHWIITHFVPFAGQALSCSRFSSSKPASRACGAAIQELRKVLAGRAPVATNDGAAGHFERSAALDQREMEICRRGLLMPEISVSDLQLDVGMLADLLDQAVGKTEPGPRARRCCESRAGSRPDVALLPQMHREIPDWRAPGPRSMPLKPPPMDKPVWSTCSVRLPAAKAPAPGRWPC